MSWSVESLVGLEGDAFEAERSRIISSYIKSLPENRRKAAYAMQCKIDLARHHMSDQQFLEWMSNEVHELGENLVDQLQYVKNLSGPPELP